MSETSLQVLLSEEVLRLFNAFSDCFDLRIGFFTAAGEEAAVGKSRGCAPFCRYVREELGRVDVCLAMDREMLLRSLEEGKLVKYRCHAGMTEAVTPLFYGDIHIGFIMIGQFRTCDKPAPAVIHAWRKTGGDPEELNQAFSDAPYYSPAKADSICDLLAMLADHITGQKLFRLERRALADRIEWYLDETLNKTVTVAEVAEAVGKGESTVSRLMKELRGTGIKELHIKKKCDYAGRLLREDPGLTVKEAAAAVGYDDPYYFSRVFKKYTGIPPSKARDSQKQRSVS